MNYNTHHLTDMLNVIAEVTGNGELQLQTLRMFAFVASRHPNEVSQREIEVELGMVQTTVSRNIAYLGKGMDRDGKGALGGYGLIKQETDPLYVKRKLVRLTPRGEQLASVLSSYFKQQ